MILAFDNCEIDCETLELRRDGVPVHVEPQVFDVLSFISLGIGTMS